MYLKVKIDILLKAQPSSFLINLPIIIERKGEEFRKNLDHLLPTS